MKHLEDPGNRWPPDDATKPVSYCGLNIQPGEMAEDTSECDCDECLDGYFAFVASLPE